jgi:hypothetical protein
MIRSISENITIKFLNEKIKYYRGQLESIDMELGYNKGIEEGSELEKRLLDFHAEYRRRLKDYERVLLDIRNGNNN